MLNVKKAVYVDSLPNSFLLIFPNNSVWMVKGGLGFREISEKELSRMPGYEIPAILEKLLDNDYDHELFPWDYFQYWLTKEGQDMGRLLPSKDYAAKVGKALRTVQQKCQLGTLPGATKFGSDWWIPENAPYNDTRVKSGAYIGARKQKKE